MFELKQALNLKLQQQLVMTPQLQQAIKLLQLSRMELVDAIQAELEQNPALEEELRPESQAVEQEQALLGQAPGERAAAEPDRQQEVSGDQESVKEIDWEQWLESYNSTPAPVVRRQQDEDLPTLEQTLSDQETLQEHLLHQLGELDLVEEDIAIAQHIVGALDERGFLVGAHPLEDIAIALELSVSHVERVLELVQGLEPIGVAARSLEECLLLQLRHRGLGDSLAARLIAEFMTALEKRNYAQIAKQAEVSLEEVAAALEVIRDLDPRPARSFGGDRSVYITPDIYVQRVGDEYQIVLNEDGLPLLRVSKYYRDVLKNGAASDAKSYVQDKLRSAQWLIRSIHQRQRTIYRVMESILKFQRDFFDKGVAHLKPLILRDVAEDIGMHESTISRVTSNKYVHTPQGLFELKYFFNSAIGTSGGGDDMASVSVKHRIKQVIEEEDSTKPLSDQAIANLLKKEGIKIARRTVAKYREALGILSSSQRRQIG